MRNLAVAHACVSASSGCLGPAAPTPVAPPTAAEIVEGLFLGSGPLAAGDCALTGVWSSYERNATVTVMLASTIDDRGRLTLERAVREVEAVIAGRFGLVVERSPEADPIPGVGQITSADVPASRVQATCSPGGSGCVRILARDGPHLISVQAIQQVGSSQRLKVHELGHALGLCHVRGERLPSAVMADPTGATAEGWFSEAELQAFRAVYASGLEPGATRIDFRRAGLLP